MVIFMNNRAEYEKEQTVKYYDNFNDDNLFEYEKVLMERFTKRDDCILDIGCGAGRFAIGLSKIGRKNVIGIDFSNAMIFKAKSKSNIKFFNEDISKRTCFKDNFFDCCCFSFNGFMLIDTFEKRRDALIEIKRILKDNGIFFFTTPFLDTKFKIFELSINNFELYNNFDSIKTIKEDYATFRIHIPTLYEIAQMANDIGFNIIFMGRRLDYFKEEKIEEELDDNWIWILKKQ